MTTTRRWADLLAGLPPRQRILARAMRTGFGPLAASVVLLQAVSATAPARHRAEAEVLAATARTTLGVPLVWDLTGTGPAPARNDNGTLIELTPLRPQDAPAALQVVSDALSTFPSGFAGRLLSAAFVVSALHYGGHPAGGMALGSAVYLVARGMDEPANRAYLRQVVFHETATVLLERFALDRAGWERAWRDANAPGFSYASDRGQDAGFTDDAPLTALRSSLVPDPALFASGLISPYGTASVRADVDSFADALFTTPDLLRAWMVRSPHIRRKARQLQQLYLSADPRFADVFAHLGLPTDGLPTDGL